MRINNVLADYQNSLESYVSDPIGKYDDLEHQLAMRVDSNASKHEASSIFFKQKNTIAKHSTNTIAQKSSNFGNKDMEGAHKISHSQSL